MSLPTPTPLSSAGIETFCPTCMAVRGQRCQSNSGRVLKETHLSRMRAALNADPIRQWLDEMTAWRRSA